MADLRLDDLSKTFPNGTRALEGVTFNIASGECVALVGPSGCGKTTLLRVIAGLETADAGTIHLDNQQINTVPAHRRDVALLFQRPAFLLQQSVRQNLRLPWTLREPFSPLKRWLGGDGAREDELTRIARLLGLEPDLDRPLQQLSGGQQQRVALGRSLLRKAKITLLDEPLGHLDAPLRVELRRQLRALAREFGLTVIHVTHDPAEALAVGDRVAVMQSGRVLQVDEPRQLRRDPTHRFVAEMIHHEDGGFNWLSGQIAKSDVDSLFESPLGRWVVPLQVVEHLRESLYRGQMKALESEKGENFDPNHEKVDMMIGIPAARVRCTTEPVTSDELVRIAVKVQDLECSTGGNWVIAASLSRPEIRWIGRADDEERIGRSQEVAMVFSMDQAYWFDGPTGRTLFAPTP